MYVSLTSSDGPQVRIDYTITTICIAKLMRDARQLTAGLYNSPSRTAASRKPISVARLVNKPQHSTVHGQLPIRTP